MEEWTYLELRRIGKAIRAARNSLGVSQEDFAEMADIHRTYVTRIELGKVNVSWENISRIARALKEKPSVLLARAGL